MFKATIVVWTCNSLVKLQYESTNELNILNLVIINRAYSSQASHNSLKKYTAKVLAYVTCDCLTVWVQSVPRCTFFGQAISSKKSSTEQTLMGTFLCAAGLLMPIDLPEWCFFVKKRADFSYGHGMVFRTWTRVSASESTDFLCSKSSEIASFSWNHVFCAGVT